MQNEQLKMHAVNDAIKSPWRKTAARYLPSLAGSRHL